MNPASHFSRVPVSVSCTASRCDISVPQSGPSHGRVIEPAVATFAGLPPILVADDDADDCFIVQRLIRKTGVENPVKVFDDGSEVVNFLGGMFRLPGNARLRTPLLLFLDLKMQGLGGFGFLEWARAQQEKFPLTIVVLSGSNEPADVARAMELGAHRYLVKYPSLPTFSTIVRSVHPLSVF